MYSDRDYDDGAVLDSEPNSIDFNATFDLNAYVATSPSYGGNPLLQTAPRAYETGMYQYSGAIAGEYAIGNGMLGSPVPSTVKKLKSNLDGTGIGGGYLCSPVGATRSQQHQQQQPPYNQHSHQQQQQQQSFHPINGTAAPSPANIADLPAMPMPAPAQPMQRLKSAPASLPIASTSAGPSSTTTRRKASGKTNSVAIAAATAEQQQQQQQSVGLGIPEAGFEELDYGSMRIYGRPLARSASADPAMKSAKGGSGTFLPYPEHLPTVTLGRGMKNTRDVGASASAAHSEIFARTAEQGQGQTQQTSMPVMKQSNLDKPYIQYVPPDSPAAKSAARNRHKLSINTAAAKSSGKLVPIRISPKKQLPLTPPMTSTSVLSPSLVPVPYGSPQKAAAMGYHGHNHVQTAPMPSFEFSLERFSELAGHNANGEPQHLDLSAMLGIPTPGTDTYSSAASSNGLLSPGPLSTTSSHSSVFSSSNDGLDQIFGFNNSPTYYSGGSESISQALASLLEGNQLQQQGVGMSSAPGSQQGDMLTQQQIDDILSPQMAPQHSISSPSYQSQHASSPARSSQQPQFSPYSQQHQQPQGQGLLYDPFQTSIDPALQSQSQQMQAQASRVFSPTHHAIASGALLLSPRPAHYGSNMGVTASGRPMSSPRRLQAMRSAPDLGTMYHDQNNPFAHSPTPRKASMKRAYAEASDEEEYDEYGEGPNGSDESQGDDDYRPLSGQPPLKKRSMSNLSSYGQSVPVPQLDSSPNRLRPGPKQKSSMPNLQSHQTVFAVEVNAPPVPPLPRAFSQAASASATSDDMDGLLVPQSGISKDQLAEYYHVGTSNRQTKKGRPQRMYICGIAGCGKEFPRKSAVESHIQTHLEDKPFACPYDDW